MAQKVPGLPATDGKEKPNRDSSLPLWQVRVEGLGIFSAGGRATGIQFGGWRTLWLWLMKVAGVDVSGCRCWVLQSSPDLKYQSR